MSWMRITNLTTNKVETEVGEKPDHFFMDKDNDNVSIPSEPTFKTQDELQQDVKAIGIETDVRRRRLDEREQTDALISKMENQVIEGKKRFK